MNIADIITKIMGGDVTSIVALVLLLLTFVQITPIKINPWSWLARKFGKAINHDLFIEVDQIKKDVQEIRSDRVKDREEMEMYRISDKRNRILRFADELRVKVDHSEEFFNQILEEIDQYEKYCDAHPGYKNSKATDAIKLIREVYHECKSKNNFI